MSRKLNTHVHVDDTWYGPHTVVPDEVAEKITNPDVWDGNDEATPVESTPVEVKQPPRKGPGSGGTAWIEFAKSKGVTQDFDSKEALITHLEDEGHIEKG
jgi:hypothetical protein